MDNYKQPHILLVLGWYFEEIHHGVAQYAKAHNWRLTASFPNQPVNLDYWNGDGIISSLNPSTPEYHFVCKTQLPVIELSELHPELPFTRISFNNRKTGQIAAEYYLNKGFRSLAFVGSSKNKQTNEREKGFTDTAAKFGIDVQSFNLSAHNQNRHTLWRSTTKFLKALPKQTGMLAAYEVTGATINTICSQEGIVLPDDIALLCCGNHELTCDWTPTPMSSIVMPKFEQGYKAAKLLDEILKGDTLTNRHIKLDPSQVIERQSTQILAVNNHAVSRAITYIKENAHRKIKVDEVVHNTNSSRRYLERAFKTHLGKTINQQITQQRIEKVKETLTQENIPTKALAYQLEFSSVQYLHKLFKEHTNMTIKQYKEKA